MSNDIDPETQRKIDMLEQAHAAQERREALAEAFSAFINGADSNEIAALANDISHDHRTLVQRKFGFFLQFCKVLDSNYQRGTYDLRNEYACEKASKIMEMVGGCAGVPNV